MLRSTPVETGPGSDTERLSGGAGSRASRTPTIRRAVSGLVVLTGLSPLHLTAAWTAPLGPRFGFAPELCSRTGRSKRRQPRGSVLEPCPAEDTKKFHRIKLLYLHGSIELTRVPLLVLLQPSRATRSIPRQRWCVWVRHRDPSQRSRSSRPRTIRSKEETRNIISQIF